MRTSPRHPRRAATALAVVLASAALAGCGGSPGEVVVTVTGSPSPAASGSSSPSGSTGGSAPTVKSDVVGRAFDFGTVGKVMTSGSTQVLLLDRWTDPSVDDKALAKSGIAVRTYERAKNPFKNVNTAVTFAIPVRPNTTFLLHHCTAPGEPLESRSVTAEELAAAPAEDKLVLLRIDRSGWTTGGETFAGC